MGTLSNEETLKYTIELLSFSVDDVVMQEVSAYRNGHPDDVITADLIAVITQKAISELMLRTGNFDTSAVTDKDSLSDEFRRWFKSSEEETLRRICRNSIKNYFESDAKSDENLTFTERYLRKIREQRNR
ncbi:MAG: hypothetical protein K6E13_10575 [Lachnospiraceae bacterium]|nr:hypothetical protein [Lachnospiraceae bacterium]